MIIYTAKLDRRRLAAGGVIAVALVCALAVFLGFAGGASTSASAEVSPKRVRTEEDRLAYLGAYGWLVKEEPIAVEELVIPKEMGPEYDEYLELQRQQGFDLEKYAGKTVRRYSYEVLNYPTGEQGIQAALLLYKNTVIGAHVMSPALDGFMHGLEMPKSDEADTTTGAVADPVTDPAAGTAADAAVGPAANEAVQE